MWKDIHNYFDFPIPSYNISDFNFERIKYYSNGINALKDNTEIIGAKKHWYSTEDIILNGKYELYISNLKIFNDKYKNVKLKIRNINYIINLIYLQPSLSAINHYKSVYKITSPSISIHLRVGDVDKMPFTKYLDKHEIENCLDSIKVICKSESNATIGIVSDSLKTKLRFKSSLKRIIISNNLPCHSKNKECMLESVIDILVLKYSERIILTRGSSFSLFGMYQNKNCMNNKSISFIGHDYEHNNYYD